MTIALNNDTAAENSHETFLAPFFMELNAKFSGKWCVLHSYESLPYYSESDVDMAFSGSNLRDLETLINSVAARTGWQLYQKFWYDVQWCCYYVLREKKTGTLLAIDFLTDNCGIGRYGFKTRQLTDNCDTINDLIPIPNHETAVCYKLVKGIEKGRSLQEDEEYLKEHFKKSDEQEIALVLNRQYGVAGKQLLMSYLKLDKTSLTDGELIFLHRKRKQHISTFRNRLKFIYWETRRIAHRISHPSGLLINVPILEKSTMKAFTNILKQKAGILFRFVKLGTDASILQKFKGISGSTLIVCPQKKFDRKKAVRYQGVYPKYMSFDATETLDFNDLDVITDTYLTLILKALSIRISSKLHSND